MSSEAEAAFRRALVDVDNLLWFHENEGGDGQGRRGAHFGSLNKSSIVLLCAAWETYVEEVVLECVDHSVDNAAEPRDMLRSLQRHTQNHIRTGKVENAWMSATGQGWRDLTKSVARSLVRGLNTPKPGPIKELMHSVLGVDDITDNWTWHRNPLGTPSDKLQAFVVLRGAIAHGERLAQSVTKANVTSAYDLVSRLVAQVEDKLIRQELLPDDGRLLDED